MEPIAELAGWLARCSTAAKNSTCCLAIRGGPSLLTLWKSNGKLKQERYCKQAYTDTKIRIFSFTILGKYANSAH